MNIFRQIVAVLNGGQSGRLRARGLLAMQAQQRFRHSMPGELGLRDAVRLYGVGR